MFDYNITIIPVLQVESRRSSQLFSISLTPTSDCLLSLTTSIAKVFLKPKPLISMCVLTAVALVLGLIISIPGYRGYS